MTGWLSFERRAFGGGHVDVTGGGQVATKTVSLAMESAFCASASFFAAS